MTDTNIREHQVIEHLRSLVEAKTLWGFSLAFVNERKTFLSYDGVMGQIPPYDRLPVKAGLCYDLASLSKVVGTASRIMQLVAEGAFTLDTPVKTLLPGFRHTYITVENLLLHNSGLPAEIAAKQTLTRDNIMERLFQTEPVYEPGTRFIYSDVGYILLGLIIKEGKGVPEKGSLEKSFKTHIFSPLNMAHTSFSVFDTQQCLPTEKTLQRGLICGQVHDSKAWLLGESGSAGLFSTLEDMAAFAQAYLQEDPALFPPKIFRMIQETQVFGRTLGWSKEYGSHTLYHTGFTGTSMLIDRNRKEAMVLLTNRIHPARDNQKFLDERKKLNQLWLA